MIQFIAEDIRMHTEGHEEVRVKESRSILLVGLLSEFAYIGDVSLDTLLNTIHERMDGERDGFYRLSVKHSFLPTTKIFVEIVNGFTTIYFLTYDGYVDNIKKYTPIF